MYVCVCNAVTDRDIREAAEAGVRNMRQLRNATGCSSKCGQCAPMARTMLEDARSDLGPAPLFPPVLEPAC